MFIVFIDEDIYTYQPCHTISGTVSNIENLQLSYRNLCITWNSLPSSVNQSELHFETLQLNTTNNTDIVTSITGRRLSISISIHEFLHIYLCQIYLCFFSSSTAQYISTSHGF